VAHDVAFGERIAQTWHLAMVLANLGDPRGSADVCGDRLSI